MLKLHKARQDLLELIPINITLGGYCEALLRGCLNKPTDEENPQHMRVAPSLEFGIPL